MRVLLVVRTQVGKQEFLSLIKFMQKLVVQTKKSKLCTIYYSEIDKKSKSQIPF
jgi:hypothetical protein